VVGPQGYQCLGEQGAIRVACWYVRLLYRLLVCCTQAMSRASVVWVPGKGELESGKITAMARICVCLQVV